MTRAACLLSDVLAMASEPGGLAASLPRFRLPFSVPEALTPGLAGLLVGAVSGVVLFGFVLFVAAVRRRTRSTGHADQAGAFPAVRPRPWAWGGVEVVRVEPYATGSQHAIPSTPARGIRAVPPIQHDPLARAGETPSAPPPSSGVFGPPPSLAPQAPRSSGVHPLAVIPGDSSVMRAVSSASADAVDDSPTEISETLFDEPPRPLRRGAPPRIRPVAPSPPRAATASVG